MSAMLAIVSENRGKIIIIGISIVEQQDKFISDTKPTELLGKYLRVVMELLAHKYRLTLLSTVRVIILILCRVPFACTGLARPFRLARLFRLFHCVTSH